jgi:hypothetical protein
MDLVPVFVRWRRMLFEEQLLQQPLTNKNEIRPTAPSAAREVGKP